MAHAAMLLRIIQSSLKVGNARDLGRCQGIYPVTQSITGGTHRDINVSTCFGSSLSTAGDGCAAGAGNETCDSPPPSRPTTLPLSSAIRAGIRAADPGDRGASAPMDGDRLGVAMRRYGLCRRSMTSS